MRPRYPRKYIVRHILGAPKVCDGYVELQIVVKVNREERDAILRTTDVIAKALKIGACVQRSEIEFAAYEYARSMKFKEC